MCIKWKAFLKSLITDIQYCMSSSLNICARSEKLEEEQDKSLYEKSAHIITKN